MSTVTLTEFLLSRIAEDEAGPWRGAEIMGADRVVGPAEIAALNAEEDQWEARASAECEAKRRIIEDYEAYANDYRDAPSAFAEGRRHAALLAVCRVAEIYADHPDYREEWRP